MSYHRWMYKQKENCQNLRLLCRFPHITIQIMMKVNILPFRNNWFFICSGTNCMDALLA